MSKTSLEFFKEATEQYFSTLERLYKDLACYKDKDHYKEAEAKFNQFELDMEELQEIWDKLSDRYYDSKCDDCACIKLQNSKQGCS